MIINSNALKKINNTPFKNSSSKNTKKLLHDEGVFIQRKDLICKLRLLRIR